MSLYLNKSISSSVRIIVLTFLFSAWGCITPSIRQTMEQNRGDDYFYNHNYSGAIDHYTRMLEASGRLGIYRNTSMESDVWRKIANCYEMMGRYEEAIRCVGNAMSLDSADGNRLNIMEDYRHEGIICLYMGLYYKGIGSLERSLAISDGMENSLKNTKRLSIAGTYLALGQAYTVLGRTNEAIDYTHRSLSIFRSAGDVRGEMESLLNLAAIYSDVGDIVAAEKFARNSYAIALKEKMGTSRHNLLLASVSVTAGEYEKALRYQESALDEARMYGIAAQVVWATIGMGDIYGEIGDLARAEKYYSEARESRDTLLTTAGSLDASLGLRLGNPALAKSYFSSEGSLSGSAISSYRMAELMIAKGIPDSAIIFMNQSAIGFKASGNLQGKAKAQVMLGKLYLDRGSNIRAGLLLDSAISVSRSPETIWQAWFQKGRLYEADERVEEAIASYRRAVQTIEKIRGNLTVDEFKSTFINSKMEVYDRLIKLLMENDDPGEAFRVSEQARARAFYDVLANRKIDFRGSLPGDLISVEQQKRNEIRNLYKLLEKAGEGLPGAEPAGEKSNEELRMALEAAQSEYEDILRKIKLNNPSYAEMVAPDPVNIKDLQARLDHKTAVLAYWVSNDELTCWTITKSEISGEVIKIERDSLNSMIDDVRRSIRANLQTEYKTRLSRLYNLLVPFHGEKIMECENLVIIPNSSLHLLPFQAMINDKGEYLVSKYNIIYAPSAGVYMICHDKKSSDGSRLLGVALADLPVENYAGLPGTEEELNNILPLFAENTSASGINSTETFVKNNVEKCQFIHFATHGSYNYRQPLYSHLLFPSSDEDDGRLNVFEVFEMDLNAKLVTLSACETGLGNISRGDELTGLSRAFLFAGSSSVIVSLWTVADHPTSLLMTSFYKYLKEYPVQKALTMAQRDVMKEYPQPLYWSSFVLIGNGNITAG